MTARVGKSLTVYLIEDDADHIILITRAIRDSGHDVTITTIDDSETAIPILLAGEPPDLVLLDINMPGPSGFDVLRLIKSDAALKYVPVVMLTSSELMSDIGTAYELGASGYISKPSLMHDLKAVLGNTLLYWSAMRRPIQGSMSEQ